MNRQQNHERADNVPLVPMSPADMTLIPRIVDQIRRTQDLLLIREAGEDGEVTGVAFSELARMVDERIDPAKSMRTINSWKNTLLSKNGQN